MSEKNTTTYVIKSNKISADLLTHILLTVFLGCFWIWPWVYKTTALLNNVNGLKFRKPSTKLALFILVPFYSIYWFRKTAKGVEFAAKQAQITISFAGICTFLSFLIPKISSIMIQMEIEKIVNIELSASSQTDKLQKNIEPLASPSSNAKNGKVQLPKVEPTVSANVKNEKTPLPKVDTVVSTKLDATVKEDEIELLCPHCKENLYFMGWEPGEKVECPFCNKEFVL